MNEKIEICKGTTTLIGVSVAGFVMSFAFVQGVDLVMRLVCGFLTIAFFLVLNRHYTILFANCKKTDISTKAKIVRLCSYAAGGLLLSAILLLPFVPLIIKALYSGIYTTLLARTPLRRCDKESVDYGKKKNTR